VLVEDASLESETVTKVAAGARHTVLLCASGAAFAFGCNKFGQAGTGSFAPTTAPQRQALPPGEAAADVEAGWWHTVVRTRAS
jgi:alpha-tubulin suppressor-like RCC1 family protein